MENAPLLPAVAEPNSVVPFQSFTVLPASAVPVIVGVLSFAGEVVDKDDGAFGAVVSVPELDPEPEPEEELEEEPEEESVLPSVYPY